MAEEKALSPNDENLSNLAAKLSEDERKSIASKIIDWYITDKDARSEWEDKRARWYKLWLMHREPKNDPWPGASNVCLPLLAVACNQFHARSYQSFFSPPEIVKTIPVEEHDVARAKRVKDYMNYQVMYDMEEFEEEHDKLLLSVPVNGHAFLKGYYDSINERPKVEYVSAMNILLPYKTKNMRSARRVIHELWLHYDELAKHNRRKGFYVDFDKIGEQGGKEPDTMLANIQDRIELNSVRADDKPKLILECHCELQLPNDRYPMPYVATVDYDAGLLLRLTSRLMKSHGKDYIANYFVDYCFIPNPEGFYSLGFGHFLENLNEMANTAFNQIFDAGRVSNQPFGFYGRRAGIKKRELKLWPGRMEEVEDATQIYFPTMQRVDQVLFQVLGLIQQYSEQFTSTSDYLLGRESKGTKTPTASGTLAIIEQGLILYSVMIKRLFRSFKKELGQLYTLNQLYMPEEKQYRITGENDEFAFPRIKQSDFEGKLDIIPVGDPSYSSRLTRRQEAQEIYAGLMANPLIVANPQIQLLQPKAVYEATKAWLETYDRKDMPNLLPKMKEESVTPEAENAMFMQGDYSKPKNGEDHQQHMGIHVNFIRSKYYEGMDKDYKALLKKHLEETQAIMYQEKAEMERLGTQTNPNMPPAGIAGQQGPQQQQPPQQQVAPQQAVQQQMAPQGMMGGQGGL